MKACFHPVFTDYKVYEDGRVERVSTKHFLVPSGNQRDILSVGLVLDGKLHRVSLARVVAEAFDIPRRSVYDDCVINKDGDRSNCSVWNLAWRTRSFTRIYNQQYSPELSHLMRGIEISVEGTQEHYVSLDSFCKAHGLRKANVFEHYTGQVESIQYFDGVPLYADTPELCAKFRRKYT